jgi:hypothetical protein
VGEGDEDEDEGEEGGEGKALKVAIVGARTPASRPLSTSSSAWSVC